MIITEGMVTEIDSRIDAISIPVGIIFNNNSPYEMHVKNEMHVTLSF